MSLGIHFDEDVASRLDALDRANRRALALAELYGMDPATARLCHAVYTGALHDVAAAFGLPLAEARRVLALPRPDAAAREP